MKKKTWNKEEEEKNSNMHRFRSKTIPVFVIYQAGCDLNFVWI